MEQPLFMITEDGRCYCQVADGIANVYVVMADFIAKWQMELPLRVSDGTWWMLYPSWQME